MLTLPTLIAAGVPPTQARQYVDLPARLGDV